MVIAKQKVHDWIHDNKKIWGKKDIFSRKKHEKVKCIHESAGGKNENYGNEAGEKRIKKVLTRGRRSDIIAELA